MTGKHRHYHRRWVVDLAACTATHDSGLIVKAIRSPDDEATDYRPLNLDAWQDKMLTTMPLPNLVPHAKRLLREAVEVYQRAQQLRH
jgi:hypothetical protein